MDQVMVELKGEPEWGREAIKGWKVKAVKLYRELFSCGLKDAKDKVEEYIQIQEGRREYGDWRWMVWLLDSPMDPSADVYAARAFSAARKVDYQTAQNMLQEFVHNNFDWLVTGKAETAKRGPDGKNRTTAGKLTDLRAVFQKGE